MADAPKLPAEVRYEPSGIHGARYVFPRRELGRFRPAGTFATLFGMIFAAIPAVIIGMKVMGMVNRGQVDPFDIVPLVFAVPFIVAGIVIAAAGLLLARGHAEIEMTGGTLLLRDRAGLLRWTRKVPLAQIKGFRVVRGVRTSGTPDWAALTAMIGPRRNRIVVAGYPEAWLQPIADELAARIADQTGAEPVPIERRAAPATTLEGDEGESLDLFEQIDEATRPLPQPATSRTKVERFEGGGVTLNVPSAGLLKGSSGLFVFSIFWCILSLVVGGGFLFAGIQGGAMKPMLIVVPIVVIFLGVGIAMLIAAINMGTRRVAIAVFDGTVMLMTKGLFGTRKLEWTQPEIKAVVVGPSGIEVNERPVLELQIHAADKKTGLLAGHDEEELYWLADEIRRAVQATGTDASSV